MNSLVKLESFFVLYITKPLHCAPAGFLLQLPAGSQRTLSAHLSLHQVFINQPVSLIGTWKAELGVCFNPKPYMINSKGKISF